MTRAEHLAWCKARALAYVDRGDCVSGLKSMMSDIGKHDETRGHAANLICLGLLMAGRLSTPAEARSFIEGYN